MSTTLKDKPAITAAGGTWAASQQSRNKRVRFILLAVLVLNVGVAAAKVTLGLIIGSLAMSADGFHSLLDGASNVVALIGSLFAVWIGLNWADLVVSVGIAFAIGWGAWAIVRDASLSLSDVAARDSGEIEKVVLAVPGVRGTHNIRSRGSEGRVWVDLHIQVDPQMNVDRAHDIASDVARRVEDEFTRPADVTVHVEPADQHHLSGQRGYSLDTES